MPALSRVIVTLLAAVMVPDVDVPEHPARPSAATAVASRARQVRDVFLLIGAEYPDSPPGRRCSACPTRSGVLSEGFNHVSEPISCPPRCRHCHSDPSVTAAGRAVGVPTPRVLVVAGLFFGFLPFVPDVTLGPDVLLIGVLPLLVYHTAFVSSPGALYP